jgi:predicted transcriptional regulator
MNKKQVVKEQSNAYDDFLTKVIVGIGEVAEITGVPIRKLRYWQEKGIISPVDPNASSRQFDLANIKKILLIQELLDDGYTLDAAAAKVSARVDKISSVFNLLNFTRSDVL